LIRKATAEAVQHRHGDHHRQQDGADILVVGKVRVVRLAQEEGCQTRQTQHHQIADAKGQLHDDP